MTNDGELELGQAAVAAFGTPNSTTKVPKTVWLNYRYRQGATIAQLSREFGLSIETVRLRVNDYTNRPNPEELTDKQKAFLLDPSLPTDNHKKR